MAAVLPRPGARTLCTVTTAVGSIKQQARGHSTGHCWWAWPPRSWAGEDHLVGLDRLGADVAGQALVPVAGLGSTTAAGLARRISAEGSVALTDEGFGQGGRMCRRPGQVAPLQSGFVGFRFPPEVIMVAVR